MDSALLPVAATQLKWSSNSYYKAINLWVLTFASPHAICFSAEGGQFKVAELNVNWASVARHCHLVPQRGTVQSDGRLGVK